MEYLKIEDSKQNGDVQYLDPKTIAEIIVDELLNEKQIDAREYVRKLEWNIYEDFSQIRDKNL